MRWVRAGGIISIKKFKFISNELVEICQLLWVFLKKTDLCYSYLNSSFGKQKSLLEKNDVLEIWNELGR